VAANARGGLNLVLQLEELGCMTLMPVSHLLPSQQARLFREAGMAVPDIVVQGRELRNQGRVGEVASETLLVSGTLWATGGINCF